MRKDSCGWPHSGIKAWLLLLLTMNFCCKNLFGSLRLRDHHNVPVDRLTCSRLSFRIALSRLSYASNGFIRLKKLLFYLLLIILFIFERVFFWSVASHKNFAGFLDYNEKMRLIVYWWDESLFLWFQRNMPWFLLFVYVHFLKENRCAYSNNGVVCYCWFLGCPLIVWCGTIYANWGRILSYLRGHI